MNARQPPAALAIDPGHTGGLALVVGDRLAGWAAWMKTTRKQDPYRWTASTIRDDRRSPCLTHAIRACLVHLPPDVDLPWGTPCAVEGLRPFGAKRGYTQLCESAGVAVSVLYLHTGIASRPLPSTWIPSVLGIPGNSATDDEERYAIASWGWGDVGRRKPWPMGVGDASGVRRPPDWAIGHVADAGCMARFLLAP